MTWPNALVVEEQGAEPLVRLRPLDPAVMPEGDLDVEVLWSSLNYKDALALTGRAPIVRAPFPFVPGIDLAGHVLASRNASFQEGDLVLQTGWGLGENRFGGYAEMARLTAESVVKVPAQMSARDAMVIGTAGFTAMLACLSLEGHGWAQGPVAVTGASGGVGSLAVAFLSRMGHEVVAFTGSGRHDYLRALGADAVMERSVLASGAARPLDSGRWGGAIDSVGGTTLEALLSQIRTRGAVASCGLVAGSELHTTVFPLILRGIGLLGIDSNTCPMPLRVRAWERIATLTDPDLIALLATEVGLEEVPEHARMLLRGEKRGRTVVRCSS
jgi:acrylyl-CoA reductase (NADPH)